MDAHLSPAALRFLRALKRNNDRTWFNERKPAYEAELKAPMLQLIAVINQAMLAWAPEHVRAPEKVLMRIYRDIRFSPDKRPYKTHVSAWWARAGMEKTSGAGFYLQVSGVEVLIAAGIYMPDRDQLLKLRRHLVDHHAQVRALLGASKLQRLGMTAMPGNPLTRPPKGFAATSADHTAAMDLLVQREWGVAGTLPAEAAIAPGFGGEVIRRFAAAAPLVDQLNHPLITAPKRAFVAFKGL